jgi:hypothetical protein
MGLGFVVLLRLRESELVAARGAFDLVVAMSIQMIFKLLMALLAVPLFGQITSYTQTFTIPPAGTPRARGVPFKDPTFNTLIVRLTDQNTCGSGLSTYPDGIGGYSEWSAFNANNTFFSSSATINGSNDYCMVAFNQANFKLGSNPVGASYAYRGPQPCQANTWSPRDPNVFYCTPDTSQKFRKYNIHGSANPANWTYVEFDLSSQMVAGTHFNSPGHVSLDETKIAWPIYDNSGSGVGWLVAKTSDGSLVRKNISPQRARGYNSGWYGSFRTLEPARVPPSLRVAYPVERRCGCRRG